MLLPRKMNTLPKADCYIRLKVYHIGTKYSVLISNVLMYTQRTNLVLKSLIYMNESPSERVITVNIKAVIILGWCMSFSGNII